MPSDTNERVNIKVAIREKGVGWNLDELAGDKQAKADWNTMGVNEAKPEVPKTVNLVPGSTVQTQHVLGLESMAFSQGGHLMPKKKGSQSIIQTVKKNYKEIHVALVVAVIAP